MLICSFGHLVQNLSNCNLKYRAYLLKDPVLQVGVRSSWSSKHTKHVTQVRIKLWLLPRVLQSLIELSMLITLSSMLSNMTMMTNYYPRALVTLLPGCMIAWSYLILFNTMLTLFTHYMSRYTLVLLNPSLLSALGFPLIVDKLPYLDSKWPDLVLFQAYLQGYLFCRILEKLPPLIFSQYLSPLCEYHLLLGRSQCHQ